ncbi:MAG: choice-of-anchor B family protein [Phycisphaerae bacterium]|jgi:choice-of-anchor B domain-containing protein
MRQALVWGYAFAVCAAAFAHQDDPKVLDREPRYEGPGWRRAIDGHRGGPAFDASGVTLMSWISLPEFGAQISNANSCTGYVSPSGREYAIIGLSHGTAFVEVTDPGNAQIVALITGPQSLWRDMRTYQNYSYSVSEGGSGIQVMDLSQIDSGVVSLVRTVLTGGATATHTMTINAASGYLYRSGGENNGLRIYNLNPDPSNPTLVTTWSTRYVHEATVITYTEGPNAGKEIAFCCGGFNGGWTNTGLTILDVTNKANIVTLANYEYPNPGYSHQGWPSVDRQYFFLNDELDEQNFGTPATTRVINISNLSSPYQQTTFTNGNTSVDHNLYVRDNLVFASNYRSGLRVFDASDPLAMTEIAYFDTYPGSDSANFNGLWNNYPYLPSGTIIGSDIERGLFVWRLDIERLEFAYPAGQPATIEPAGGTTMQVQIAGMFGAEIDPPTATLHVDSGAGFQAIPLSPLGGDLYEAVFPAAGCGDTVQYYVSAQTTTGATFTSPSNAPAATYSALAVDGILTVAFEDMEAADAGWTVNPSGSDTATTGLWTRVNPNGTAAQPEDDHTPGAGTTCWVTGQGGVGGGVGDNDVDGGRTTLRSESLDLSGLVDPRIGYWRWYSNDQGSAPNTDVFTVDVSNDNGASWTNVEVVGPAGEGTSGGWIYHEFRVADLVTPTAQVRLRFIADDAGSGSIVEAAIDDVQATDIECAPNCPLDLDGDGVISLGDLSNLLTNYGATGVGPEGGDFNDDGTVDLADLSELLTSFGLPC